MSKTYEQDRDEAAKLYSDQYYQEKSQIGWETIEREISKLEYLAWIEGADWANARAKAELLEHTACVDKHVFDAVCDERDSAELEVNRLRDALADVADLAVMTGIDLREELRQLLEKYRKGGGDEHTKTA